MTSFGKIDVFQPEAEEFSAYLERVELYFEANGIKQDKQVPVFLSVLGAKTYSLLRTLVAPESPRSKEFKTLAELLKDHFQPKPLVIAERFTFHRRNQQREESVMQYLAELRRLATHCEFKDYLDEALRDRFVCGLNSEAIQKRLLTEDKLDLKRALELAQGMEAAHRNAQVLQEGNGTSEITMSHSSNSAPNVVAQMQDEEIDRVGKYPRPQGASGTGRSCYRCGRGDHMAHSCVHKDSICHNCKKPGHLARVCRSQSQSKVSITKQHHWVEQTMSKCEGATDLEEDVIFNVSSKTTPPYMVVMEINGQSVTMEIDTGAAVTVMSQECWEARFAGLTLEQPTLCLRTYTAEKMTVLGETSVLVRYGKYKGTHKLYVVEGKGPTLLGRDWLRSIHLDWASIKSVSGVDSNVDKVVGKYPEVFQEGLGTLKHFKATLHLMPGATPRFCRPRPLPFSIREQVEGELDRLVEQGILQKVDYSEWAAPIVPVPKSNGAVRICGDYKVTINPSLQIDKYPLPRPTDLFTCLTGGKVFTKLDLTAAYQQMLLDETSSKLVTINTTKGLFRYTRLPFGVASAPAVFQKTMETILQGMPRVICYLDDILITGRTETEHAKNLEEVLCRLQEHGVRLKREKCCFFQTSVEYLGHSIDAKGVHTTKSKVKAIQDAPIPTNVQELRSFLGLLNYYAKFIPNLASLLHPLHTLLRANQPWRWTKECTTVFNKAKSLLSAAPVLVHYNPDLPLCLAGDASAYGVGAVLSHVFPDGSEHPIAFASRTLTATERNYAQVEKEALSLIFGVKKFHQYVYGREFTLITDHKPLTTILGPKDTIPSLAAARLQRWALLLAGYSYKIKFRPTSTHSNADGLSRLPLRDSTALGYLPDATNFNIAQIDALPVTSAELEVATQRDSILSKVLYYTRTRWPNVVKESFKPYWNRRLELSIEGNTLLCGIRVVVPLALRQRIMEDLHQGHQGVVRMKALARSHFWWPKVDEDVEKLVKSCSACQSVKNAPIKAPLHPWAWPTVPWQRVHVDFAGPFAGKMFLLVVDAHSKWPEVCIMSTTTASKTVTVLREIFARYGLPQQLVSDNGPQFVAEEFSLFLKLNGVKHIRCAPYHPASNGAVERMVQTMKQSLKAGLIQGVPVEQSLTKFLLQYRVTPHAVTGASPSSLFLGRTIRTRLDLLHPDISSRVQGKQLDRKTVVDTHRRMRQLAVGQQVMTRDFYNGGRWIPGTVIDQTGPVSYRIRVQGGRIWRRHIDHMLEATDDGIHSKQSQQNTSTAWNTMPSDNSAVQPPTPGQSVTAEAQSNGQSESDTDIVPHGQSESVTDVVPQDQEITDPEADVADESTESPRYPTRQRRPPSRFKDFVDSQGMP